MAALLVPVFVLFPDPARAASTVDGYVWASEPATASYAAATGYEHNSTGGGVEITRAGPGRYQVRFVGMGVPGGVAHAAAHGTGTGLCVVANWSATGKDEVVSVRCFDAAGTLADTRFLASFTNRQPSRSTFAYLWSNNANPPGGSYTPSATYRYDSTGTAPTVERVAVGQYFVYLGAVDEIYPGYEAGLFQVTAYGTAAVHCAQGTVNDELPAPITVRCFDADGDPVDSRFALSFAHGLSPLGTAGTGGTAWIRFHADDSVPAGWTWAVSGWSGPGGEPTITHLNTGVYGVSFPGVASDHGFAIANAYTNGAQYCHVVGWQAFGDDETVLVGCFDAATDLPYDADVTAAFLP